MVSRAEDWFKQALRDYEHARKSAELGDYEWACFAAHQAAEKAVKALYQVLGVETWGHSISRMLANLPEIHGAPKELVEGAKELDRHYIPSGYLNFHPEGAPFNYYAEADAERAIRQAGEIIEFARNKIIQA
ncbi:MAG: HEPN domain-containing protein [Candidatus Bathyarchaeota archaeon]|nr:HEPN domain-containing protein [Candidatus Bathyarchaeota archaeon]MCX8177297.1 HEPN domain-containing protein [Candidatus Bathyarchaeota archaeon]MDW8193743.1 HEPN domain-containing protein [Nitrososphaerota archaeon]